jgi:hypothetical protein
MIVICTVAVPLPVFAAFPGAVVGRVIIELVPELAHPASDTRSMTRNAARKYAPLDRVVIYRSFGL